MSLRSWVRRISFQHIGFKWAIQDSNLGPLPYQAAVRGGRKRLDRPCSCGILRDDGQCRSGGFGRDPIGFGQQIELAAQTRSCCIQHSAARRYRERMAYSAKAAERRRCRAICRDGTPCRGWAIWGHPEGLCSTHAGRTRGRRERRWRPPAHARYEKCRCEAYAWPHRPGGGFCRWPDPPLGKSPTRPGTHSWPRLRSAGALAPSDVAVLRFGANAQTRRSSYALDAPPERTILEEIAHFLRQGTD